MRVLSGLARGVPLKTVPDLDTRPILDRVKKSLFSMLDAAGLMVDARVADLYAGTGTQGIEALSRGAERCLFVEKRRDAVALLEENLAKIKSVARADVRCASVASVLNELVRSSRPEAERRFDLILYDPPFSFVREDNSRAEAESELALAGQLLYPKHARLVLRFEKKAIVPQPRGLELARHWTDGPHAFAFYKRAEGDASR
ncbi:MAG TPA: RsmD family RNA methyltransferase [Planctomycetota bacterium]|nr:RsmD family RNA methyltransferase [Planctomycetota bacterium]